MCGFLKGTVAMLLLGMASPAMADMGADQLVGTWVGATMQVVPSPAGGSAYLRRSVSFTPGIETIKLEAFADEAATQPLFTYESTGPYTLIGPSAAVPGAMEVDLTNDRSLVTIHVDTPDLWAGLNLGDCQLKVGEAVDIADCASGPPFLGPVCVEMDLVHVTETGLRFGDENTDRCTIRPSVLDDWTYVRAAG